MVMGLKLSRSSWDGHVDEEILSITGNMKWRNGISKYRLGRGQQSYRSGPDRRVESLPPLACSSDMYWPSPTCQSLFRAFAQILSYNSQSHPMSNFKSPHFTNEGTEDQ